MEKCVKLVRASAGAGKTHLLTQQYIDMLLDGDEKSYRHILAVTFTNKATDEMKSRVIEELYKISHNPSDPRQKKAKSRLTAILHDYSGFSVSTIDSFFQVVMRAFAREIGQYASYKVELDLNAVIAQAVDRMMDSLDDPANADLLEWLRIFSISQIESGKKWNITESLLNMAKLFFREDFKIRKQEHSSIVDDRSAIGSFAAELDGIIREFKGNLKEHGCECRLICKRAGLDLDSFKGKSRGPFMVFGKWEKGEITAPSEYSRFEEHCNVPVPGLMEAVDSALKFFNDGFERYNTAVVIRDNLHLLGIYTDIFRQINEYLSGNNIVLLSQTTEILNRIIDGNDTPFIYEKIGSKYEHILLDESQDTSLLQWRNFLPMFLESRSQGYRNLIVGDIKQSIYRWRGSDWKLISEYAKKDLGEEYVDDSISLDENWRSLENIVEFNYRLFSKIGDALKLENEEIGTTAGFIYDGCLQTLPEEHSEYPKGRVKIGFVKRDDDWKEAALGNMLGDIRELVAKGYRYNDITVLVRTNKEGSQAADFLIRNNIGVITEDSLLISSSPCVAKLTAVLNYLVAPQEAANRLLVEDCADRLDNWKVSGSLYDTCENVIRGGFFEVSSTQTPFVMAFMDEVIAYQDKYGSSLRGFVKWWNDVSSTKSICAPSGQNAIRVMTIHKSKGLSLDAVIIPFLEEVFVKKGSLVPTIWCSTSGEFESLGLVPLKATKELDSTQFSRQYRDELTYGYIDCINTAYVALTRAKSQLIVYAPEPEKPDDFKLSSFSNYMFSSLRKKLNENGCFILGDIDQFRAAEEKGANVTVDKYVSVPVGDRLSLSLRSADFFDQTADIRKRGIELHEIMSKVNVLDDLQKACGDDEQSFRYLSERFAAVPAEWFDASFETLNENAVVDADGSLFRPDRVLLDRSRSKAVVVDYKFGVQHDKYLTQVRKYCSLVSEMGFEDVEGYLWYVESGLVIKV